jgi:carboxyl-terminal processing protease
MNDQQNQPNNPLSKALQPLLFSVMLVVGILIGIKISGSFGNKQNKMFGSEGQSGKINEFLNYVEMNYVDTISKNRLLDETMGALVQNLDPHSAYIPASELAMTNESLEGNFEGIGIEFNILHDTIFVVAALSGGPSEALGIKAGDRIIKVENKTVAGVKITNKEVFKLLRGEGGTKVKVGISRRGVKDLLWFSITRGKIPVNSIDAAFMITKNKGVIKIGRFAQNTYEEYLEAFQKLKSQGMQNIILDLRGNPGGFLNIATKLCDEFLEDQKLMVYTEGRARPRENFYASSKGFAEKNKIAILIDEGSASASEIVAGALQDNDRGIIIGRRSFGKGLVQEQTDFSDGSAVRLTIARYYTPTGRCIQKPYIPGQLEDYAMDEVHRYKSGELTNKDSIKFADSLKFKTPKGKVVYGGGGIMPDIFVPIDTSKSSNYLTQLYIAGLINQFAVNYSDKNRNTLTAFANYDRFEKEFQIDDRLFNEFLNFAEQEKVKRNEKDICKSGKTIKNQLKASIARCMWRSDAFYKILSNEDKVMQEAVKALQ